MKKSFFVGIFILMLLPLAFAGLQVKQLDEGQVMVVGMDQPAVFNLELKNTGGSGDFKFLNLIGFSMEPQEYIHLDAGEVKQIQMKIYPRERLDYLGYYALNYIVKDRYDVEQASGELRFKIVELQTALVVGAQQIDPQSQTITIYLKNKENYNFKNMNVRFTSPFFEKQNTFDLNALESKTETIQLDKEQFKHLLAGYYTLTARVDVNGKVAYVEGVINFIEKDVVSSIQKDEGFIINTKVIRKSNQGNLVANTQTIIKKNIISRLFTTISPQPDVVKREGFSVYYTWNRELSPGENLDIEVKTNWLFPFIALIFVLAIVILVRIYTKTHVDVEKKVSFVKAKGGEFALKVTLNVKAKDYLEKVSIIDKLPPLTQIYEKFGGEQPVRVNEKAGRIEWMFDKLAAGETRVITYIIYSKVGVLGKFELPPATIVYEKNGEVREAMSNKAFFVAEQSSKN